METLEDGTNYHFNSGSCKMAVISGVGTRDSIMLDLENNTSMGVVLVGRMHQQWELEVFEQRLTRYLPRLKKCMYLVKKCSSIAIVTRAEVSFSDTLHSGSNVYFYLLDIISR